MLVARYLYVLSLVVWLGGMVALGMIAAPATFGVLEAREGAGGRATAGAVFGETLRRFHLMSYVAGALMLAGLTVIALMGPRPRAFGLRMGIVAGMLALSLYSGVVLSGRIQRLQAEVGAPMGSLPENDPRRAQFGRLHGLATVLMLINVAGGLVLLYWEASE
jgi:uncharacterized membrane protein